MPELTGLPEQVQIASQLREKGFSLLRTLFTDLDIPECSEFLHWAENRFVSAEWWIDNVYLDAKLPSSLIAMAFARKLCMEWNAEFPERPKV